MVRVIIGKKEFRSIEEKGDFNEKVRKEMSNYKQVLKEVKKSNNKKEKKILSKPKARLRSIDPKAVLRSFGGDRLVREGRTGHFNDEYEETISWLS